MSVTRTVASTRSSVLAWFALQADDTIEQALQFVENRAHTANSRR